LERGMSQAALAEGGMSTGYLSRLESGARPPTDRVIDHLTKRLGVPVSAFEEPQPQGTSLARTLAAVTSAERDDDQLAERLAEALRAGETLDPALRWQALWLLSRMRGNQGQHDEERALLTELIALSDELGSAELRARARTQLSRCLRMLGDNTAATEYAAQAHGLAAELSPTDRAATLQALLSAEAEAGRLADARAHADELCKLTDQVGGTHLVEALWASATVRIRQGDYVGARAALERALGCLDSRADLMLWMRIRLAAASLYLQITPPMTDQARARLDEVASMPDLIGADLHRQQMLTLRAYLAFEEGRIDDARALCEQLDGQELRLSFRDRIRFQALRGQLLILAGRLDEGTQLLKELAQQAQDALNVELAAEIWRNLAKTLADAYGSRNAGQDRPTGNPPGDFPEPAVS
jgi:transcriptional regulator with XRE-family HTH domain